MLHILKTIPTMKNDQDIHHRRSVRLRGYDYGKEGMYFITICTQNRVHFFGEVENGNMILNPFGEIAFREWEKLPDRWPHVELGAFQIMPNHIHGILLIHRPVSAVTNLETGVTKKATPNDGAIGSVGATLVVAPNDVAAPNEAAALNDSNLSIFPPECSFSKIQWATRPYLGQIIGAYKSKVSTEILILHKKNQPGVWLDQIWQRGFDERTIRNVEAFDNISSYIINNPLNWESDKFFD